MHGWEVCSCVPIPTCPLMETLHKCCTWFLWFKTTNQLLYDHNTCQEQVVRPPYLEGICNANSYTTTHSMAICVYNLWLSMPRICGVYALVENYAQKNCNQNLQFFWPAWFAIARRLKFFFIILQLKFSILHLIWKIVWLKNSRFLILLTLVLHLICPTLQSVGND